MAEWIKRYWLSVNPIDWTVQDAGDIYLYALLPGNIGLVNHFGADIAGDIYIQWIGDNVDLLTEDNRMSDDEVNEFWQEIDLAVTVVVAYPRDYAAIIDTMNEKLRKDNEVMAIAVTHILKKNMFIFSANFVRKHKCITLIEDARRWMAIKLAIRALPSPVGDSILAYFHPIW